MSQTNLHSNLSIGDVIDTSLFFNLSLDLFCISGTDGYFKKVNPAFSTLLGYTEQELLSRPYIDLVHPDDRAYTLKESLLIQKGQKECAVENRFRKKNGEYCWLSWSKTLIAEKGLIYSVARDVTEIKLNEQRLRNSIKETKKILETITDGFYAVDRNGIVTYMNQASETFTGKKRSEVLGRNIWEAFPEAVQTPLYQLVHAAIQELKRSDFELHYEPLDQWLEVILYPSKDGLSVFLRNITDKKKQEQQLQEANDRYELITEATSSAIWEWTIGTSSAYWYGKKMQELLGSTDSNDPSAFDLWKKRVHPDDLPGLSQQFEKAIQGRSDYFVNEYRTLNKYGAYVYVRNRCRIIRDSLGKAVKIIGVMDDITMEKEATDALHQSEQDYRSLFDNAPLPQLIYNLENFGFIDVNDAAIRHYGFSREEFQEMTVLDIRAKEARKSFPAIAARLRTELGPIKMTTMHLKKNGEKMKVELTTSRVTYKGQQARLSTVNDITEKIKLQEELTRQRIQEQAKIAKATFAALQKERSLIGKELHDNVNQILASAKVFLELTLDRTDFQPSLIERTMGIINRAIEEIRLLSRSLTSPIIRELGLLNAVKETLQPYLLSKKFKVHFTVTGNIEKMHHDIQFAVLRIIQEQLNNIHKHAGAKNVWLSIDAGKECIEVSIKDDGKGFNASAVSEGIGLKNIRNRVALLNGKAEFVPLPGSGCLLSVHIPCSVTR